MTDNENIIQTLRWYADPKNYEESAPRDCEIDGNVPISDDKGDRARAALAAAPSAAKGSDLTPDVLEQVKSCKVRAEKALQGPLTQRATTDLVAGVAYEIPWLCDLLLARQQSAAEGQGWVSVKERLPKPLENVLIVNINGHMKIEFIARENRWFASLQADVTHWMPLPAPPVAAAAKDQQ